MYTVSEKNATFFHEYTKLPYPKKHLQIMYKKFLCREKILSGKTVNVILCSDYKMKKLNSNFRKKNKTTDVLSFFLGDEDILGEIYISLQRAAIQCKKFNTTYNNEITRLFIHGMSHLLGYDHKTRQQQSVMEVYEQSFFNIS